MAVQPIPPGYHSVTANLVIQGAAQAIEEIARRAAAFTNAQT